MQVHGIGPENSPTNPLGSSTPVKSPQQPTRFSPVDADKVVKGEFQHRFGEAIQRARAAQPLFSESTTSKVPQIPLHIAGPRNSQAITDYAKTGGIFGSTGL